MAEAAAQLEGWAAIAPSSGYGVDVAAAVAIMLGAATLVPLLGPGSRRGNRSSARMAATPPRLTFVFARLMPHPRWRHAILDAPGCRRSRPSDCLARFTQQALMDS